MGLERLGKLQSKLLNDGCGHDVGMLQHPTKVRGAAAVSGGGFAADGDLILGGIVGSRCGH